MAMPEMGFEEVPMSPAMREETVTNRKPKITTRIDAIRLAPAPVGAPGTGLKVRKAHIRATITAEPARTRVMGRSREVRPCTTGAPVDLRRSAAPARSAPTMVGVVLIRVMRPAAATAPAPM
jgi:hypothetical protein